MQSTADSLPSPSPGHGFRVFWAEARYDWVANWRQSDFAVPTLLFPALFYLFFGVLFGKNAGLATYLVATYGAFGVIGTALFGFGVGTAVARDSGELRLKQVSPLPPLVLLGAKLSTSLAFSVIVLLELFTLAAVLGGVRFERETWLGLGLILLVGTVPFAALGLAIGTHVSGKGAPSIVNLFYLPSAFLSGLWIPIQMLPETLQNLAFFLPPFHLAQLALGQIDLDMGHSWVLHVAVLVGLTLVSLLVAARGLRR